MKLYSTILLSLAAASSLGAAAQTPEVVDNPNRVLMVNQGGSFNGYVLDRIDQLQFARVDGPCTAEITIFGFDKDTQTLSLKVIRQEGCEGFRIGVVPTVVANQLTTDMQAISYLTGSGMASPIYNQDFEQADLSGMDLTSGADYTVITIGVDRYGVEAGVSRATFSVESEPIEGQPAVEMKIDQVTLDSFTCTFTPNDDCYEYYYVAGERGQLESQYEMFAPMMGFSCIGDMIKSWGISQSGVSTYTWKNMDPNTEYEVMVQPMDAAGNMGDHQVFYVSTQSQGGTGEATVTVTLGDYKLQDWGGEQKPSQFVTYTPNDQTWRFRFSVYTAAEFDANPDGCWEYVMSEPPQPMAYWWFFEPTTTDYQIDPNTEFVVLAAAQNANGEWGPGTEYRATTPGQANAPALNRVTPRLRPVTLGNAQGRVRLTGKLMLK